MKKVVKEAQCTTISLDKVGEYGCYGLQFRNHGQKYIAVQTGHGKYKLLCMDDDVGLNRRTDNEYNGVDTLVRAFIDAYDVYQFSSSREMLLWLID